MGALLARHGALAAAAVSAAAAGCGPSRVDLPPIPMEIVAVRSSYESPTGDVPADAVAPLAALQSRLATLDATHLGDVVSTLLASLRQRLDGSGLPTDPATTPREHRPIIVGSVTLDRTCRGWDDARTTPDPANGTIEVTGEYQSGMLQKVIWGTATTCRERVDVANGAAVHAYLDGSLAVYLEGALASDPTQASYLAGWSGTIGTENATASVTFDFRVVPPQLEVRIPVADGDVIGSIGANMATLRGANGTYGCSLQTFTCELPSVARGAAPPP
ncbi:MAG TPA: hypothetical protein VHL80_09515 [Polyangia bacterium]|nr:hypothetical protein [Polyangia bacterium]